MELCAWMEYTIRISTYFISYPDSIRSVKHVMGIAHNMP